MPGDIGHSEPAETCGPHVSRRASTAKSVLNPQGGANAAVAEVDIVAIVVDRAVGVDVRGVVRIDARRPKPPVGIAVNAYACSD